MINTVAVVSGGSPDYLIDIVADGMVRLLGHENVYIKYAWSRPGAAEDTKFSFLYAATKDHQNQITLADCQALVASVRVPGKYIDEYTRTTGGAVAILDGEDMGELKQEYLSFGDLYFKREYFRNERYPVRLVDMPRVRRFSPAYYKRYPKKVRNLSLGIVPFPDEISEANVRKTGAAFFAGNVTSKVRRQLKDMMTASGYTYLANILTIEEYIREVRKHWICIAPRGSGWDTYRYWEIPYLGSVLLCENHPLKFDDDFVHGKSCLRFSTIEEARLLIDEYLLRKDELSRIADEGQRLVMERHLSVHRAAKVLEALRSLK
jgi:hypothetical protein